MNEALEENVRDELVLVKARKVLEDTSKNLRKITVEMRFAQ